MNKTNYHGDAHNAKLQLNRPQTPLQMFPLI